MRPPTTPDLSFPVLPEGTAAHRRLSKLVDEYQQLGRERRTARRALEAAESRRPEVVRENDDARARARRAGKADPGDKVLAEHDADVERRRREIGVNASQQTMVAEDILSVVRSKGREDADDADARAAELEAQAADLLEQYGRLIYAASDLHGLAGWLRSGGRGKVSQPMPFLNAYRPGQSAKTGGVPMTFGEAYGALRSIDPRPTDATPVEDVEDDRVPVEA